jgi:Dak1 domain
MPGPRFVNDATSFVAESFRGAVAATVDLRWVPDPGYLARRDPLPAGQVALVSGGGSGHEPLHAGFIGEGRLAPAGMHSPLSRGSAVTVAGPSAAVTCCHSAGSRPNISHAWWQIQSGYSSVMASNSSRSLAVFSLSRPKSTR